jgi:hypothetical protein
MRELTQAEIAEVSGAGYYEEAMEAMQAAAAAAGRAISAAWDYLTSSKASTPPQPTLNVVNQNGYAVVQSCTPGYSISLGGSYQGANANGSVSTPGNCTTAVIINGQVKPIR